MVDVAREIACTSSGYHMLTRRAVTLVLAADGLSLREDGRVRQIGREDVRPMMWTGRPGSKPLMPMPALVLTTERGEWIVGAADMTVHLDDASEQESPAPHVWVSGDDLAGLARACGVVASRVEPPHISTTFMIGRNAMLGVAVGVGVLSLLSTVLMMQCR